MLKTMRLATTLLWREWRQGEWLIVFFSLVIAIGALTAIHFYTDRLTRGLDAESARFLGGELAVTSPSPIPILWKQKAASLDLKTAEVWSFPSVVSSNQAMQLVNIQAVSNEYPLLGKSSKRIQPETIWVEPRIVSLLSTKMDETLTIGSAKLRITQLLTPDVDMLNTGFAIAPRVMMRIDDVAATRTIIPGSRVDYRLLLSGKHPGLSAFTQWITSKLSPSQRLIDVNNQPFAVKDILFRANQYIQLTLLICLIMAGVAIALSIQQYLRRHYADVALWRCLGATKKQIMAIYIWHLAIMAFITGAVAVSIGYVAQSIFADLFQHFLSFALPKESLAPVLLGFASTTLLLFAFAYPVISELPNVSPLSIWRNDVNPFTFRGLLFFGVAFIGLCLFIYGLMGFSLLTLFMIGILIISIACFYLLSLFFLSICHAISSQTQGVIRRGLSQLIQYASSASLQFVGFGLILSLILTLWMVQTFIIQNWQQMLPKSTPNYFVINIALTDIAPLKEFFAKNSVAIEGIYPMVRGRLIALNGKPIASAVPTAALNNNALHRELNLSWMWQFPSDNKIVAGRPWVNEVPLEPEVSVEYQLAQDLQLHLGDRLTFQIGDQKESARIVNFRQLNWSSFHPNFFMIFSPGSFEKFPTTYITSIHLTNNQTNLLNELIKQFPNITVIDVANLLQQIQDLLNQVMLAIEYLFGFALLIGVFIFMACLEASMDERRQTYYLLRVLGAGNRFIRNSLIVEFAALFAAILCISIGFAYLITFLLKAYFFTI